jgi:hypothetical protein
MTWRELSQRPERLRALLLKTLKATGKTPQFYFEEKLGTLSDTELESYLNTLNPSEKMTDSTPEPRQPNESKKEDESRDRMLPEDIRQVRSIGWIRKNGLTDEDRQQAERMYRELVMDLWYKHVAETGQTYYPPLQNELLDEYTLQAHQ